MTNRQLGIGVIGYGYWGPNLVRNFSNGVSTHVVSICDLDSGKLAMSQRLYPGVTTTSDFRDLLTNPAIDAVAIATPTRTHYELALAALKAGKHVFVEKPLAPTADQVRRLIDEANRRNLILMVDHTFLYTPAVQKIRELIHTDQLGEIYYYDSIRSSLGLFQSDVNVIWDLAVHDISIIQYHPRGEAGCGFRDRLVSCRRLAREYGAHHAVLRVQMRRPRQRQLAFPHQGASDLHRRQQAR